jgi:hypothetical protein
LLYIEKRNETGPVCDPIPEASTANQSWTEPCFGWADRPDWSFLGFSYVFRGGGNWMWVVVVPFWFLLLAEVGVAVSCYRLAWRGWVPPGHCLR